MADIREILVGQAGGRNEVLEKRPREFYDHILGMNPSTLVHGLESMYRLHYFWDHPRPDSDAMQWGRAAHTLFF